MGRSGGMNAWCGSERASRGGEALGVRCDLKVCERCGVLWLREVKSKQKHCARCRRELKQSPAVTELRVGRRTDVQKERH